MGSEMCIRDRVACAGVTLKAVATAIDIPLKSGTVSAEGDLDFRGTLGVAKDAPVGFAQIRLHFDVDLPRPRDRQSAAFDFVKRRVLVALDRSLNRAAGAAAVEPKATAGAALWW